MEDGLDPFDLLLYLHKEDDRLMFLFSEYDINVL